MYVDHHLWGTAPQTREVAAGMHTILWGFYSTDYVLPQDQVVEVKEGQTTSVVGIYVPTRRAQTSTAGTSTPARAAPTVAVDRASYSPAGASITVSTDRISYSSGQVLKVSGTVSPIISGQAVAIMVNGPSGDLRAIDQIDIDGTYSKNVMTFTPDAPSGTWIVKATYQKATATCKFSF